MALPEINGQLHLARKAGVLVYGIEELSIELKRDKVALVLFSATIGKSAARKLRNWQEQYRQVAFFAVSEEMRSSITVLTERIKVIAVLKSGLGQKISAAVVETWSQDGKKV